MWTLFLVPAWYNDAPAAEFQFAVFDHCERTQTFAFTEYSKTLVWLPALLLSPLHSDEPTEIGTAMAKTVVTSLRIK